MTPTRNSVLQLFFTNRWYLSITALVVLFVLSYFFESWFPVVKWLTIVVLTLTVSDILLLLIFSKHIHAKRLLPERLNLGTETEIEYEIENSSPFLFHIELIDELPEQYQIRNFSIKDSLPALSKKIVRHSLTAPERGEYHFGFLQSFFSTRIGFLQKQKSFEHTGHTKVYPAFNQLKKYQLLAFSQNQLAGIKKVRRLGHSLEFEKIKEYVSGDDIRTINWKATARKGGLMVNTFIDTRQQNIYCLIDKGRSMKTPTDGLSLLDHSINSALALSNIVLMRHDKAGLITFNKDEIDMVAADRGKNQLTKILECLYRQETSFEDNDYSRLWVNLHNRIPNRSFLVLYTNFLTYANFERQLPFLKKIASRHLVAVVFFENNQLKEMSEHQPNDLEGVYVKTIADRFLYEQKIIAKELHRHGLIALLTSPKNLSIDVINKYLELKSRQEL